MYEVKPSIDMYRSHPMHCAAPQIPLNLSQVKTKMRKEAKEFRLKKELKEKDVKNSSMILPSCPLPEPSKSAQNTHIQSISGNHSHSFILANPSVPYFDKEKFQKDCVEGGANIPHPLVDFFLNNDINKLSQQFMDDMVNRPFHQKPSGKTKQSRSSLFSKPPTGLAEVLPASTSRETAPAASLMPVRKAHSINTGKAPSGLVTSGSKKWNETYYCTARYKISPGLAELPRITLAAFPIERAEHASESASDSG